MKVMNKEEKRAEIRKLKWELLGERDALQPFDAIEQLTHHLTTSMGEIVEVLAAIHVELQQLTAKQTEGLRENTNESADEKWRLTKNPIWPL